MRNARFRLIAIGMIVVCGACLVFQALASPSQAAVDTDKIVNLDASSNSAVASDALSALTLTGTVGVPRDIQLGRVTLIRLYNSPFLP